MVTNSWMKSTWLAATKADIHLQVAIADILYQQQGNIELVWLFLQHGIRPPILNALHRCRMYLKVFLLLDICKGSGNQVLPQFWDKPHPAELTFLWPKSIPPTESDWRNWHMVLHQVLNLRRQLQLGHPLGNWGTSVTGWFWDPNTMALWHLTTQGTTRHGEIPKWGWT